jgi:hypothetical protein
MGLKMTMQTNPEQRNRRNFFRLLAAGTALLPLLVAKTAHAATYYRYLGPPRSTSGGYDDEAHCLVRGTAILTDKGSVAIESLEIGNLVMTESGALKPIVGVGRMVCSKAADAPWDASVAPILVAQSAISPGVPERDLYVAANHSVWIDGHLIPVRHLINGSSIVQAPTEVDTIEYYHLEFAQHEVMYAEGLGVESLQVADAETYRIFTEFQRDDSAIPVAAMASYGPVLDYAGGRQEAVALARLAIYPLFDVRDRIQIIHDRLAARAKALDAAQQSHAA